MFPAKYLRLPLSLSAALVVACASSPDGPRPPTEGHSFLTIVGDSDMYVADGVSKELVVLYHDDQMRPLTGEVAFDLLGDPRGGDLSATASATDAEGLARIEVVPGEEARFVVEATARYAEPVQWTIDIGPGGWALDATGDYLLTSELNLTEGVPGPVGTAINTLLDLTDDPTDPSTWVIDAILGQINNQTITAAVGALRPGLDTTLNQLLISTAPDLIPTIINVGDDLEQVARHFGVTSTLSVGRAPDAGLIATHAIDTVLFTVEGEVHEYTLSADERTASTAVDIPLRLRGQTKLAIDSHQLPIAYGRLLVFILDEAIVPSIVPTASNLGELMIALVDCARVGQLLAEQIGVGAPVIYDVACRAGLTAAGAAIESQLTQLDATTHLTLGGDARPRDLDGNRTIDRLQGGEWEGELRFSPDVASALRRPSQTFTGERR